MWRSEIDISKVVFQMENGEKLAPGLAQKKKMDRYCGRRLHRTGAQKQRGIVMNQM